MSNCRKDNISFRFDSEYLKKEYLLNIQSLRNYPKGFLKLREHIEYISGGATPLGAEYEIEGIKFLRVQNIMQNYFNLNEVVYISSKQNEEIKRSSLKTNDVLLTITGVSYGKSTVVPRFLEGSNINQHSVKITLKNTLNPFFLATFLNSKIGKLQSDKNIVGVTRPALDYEVIKNFLIPNISSIFQKEIERLVIQSQKVEEQSKALYSSAETLLLEAIGLQDFTPSREVVNVKSFKDSFLSSGRLDAEYYQVKYDDLENYFDNFKRIKLSDLVNHPISSGTTPKAGGEDYTDETDGVPFVRAVDLHGGEVITDNFNYIKSSVHNGILSRTQLMQNDVLFSIAGTVGRTALFKHKFAANINQAIAILRFNETEVLRLYLVVFFNSKIGKEFVSKYSRQGVQTNLNLSEVGDLSIPIIDISIQRRISTLVQESFALKQASEGLLTSAKQAVEVAIEEGEEKGMEMLNNI